MNTLSPNIAKWGARAHLVGLGIVFGYGLNQGDLLAAYDSTLVFLAFNPLMVGASIGITGVANSLFAPEAVAMMERLNRDETDNADEDEMVLSHEDYNFNFSSTNQDHLHDGRDNDFKTMLDHEVGNTGRII